MKKIGSTELINIKILLALLALIENDDHISLDMVSKKLGIARRTASRILALARSLLGMKIVWKDRAYYKIEDWGILNPVTIKKRIKQMNHADIFS